MAPMLSVSVRVFIRLYDAVWRRRQTPSSCDQYHRNDETSIKTGRPAFLRDSLLRPATKLRWMGGLISYGLFSALTADGLTAGVSMRNELRNLVKSFWRRAKSLVGVVI